MKCSRLAALILAVSLVSFSACSGRKSGADGKMTYWAFLAYNIAANYVNMGQTPYGRALQEQTGIEVEYLHPAGNLGEQFSLIIASGDFPDIMEYNWLTYGGGPENAIAEGVILRLNDVFEKYCPNITAYLKANPDIDRMVRTDSGSYYCFPFIRGNFGLLVSSGPMIRKDWLDELGLGVPQTIGEWETALTAFRDRKGSPAPFTTNTANNLVFAFAYDVVPRGFMVGDDGKMQYSPIENGYREFLITMARWYRERLLDPDILSITNEQMSTKMTRGISGSTQAALGSGMGVWTGAARREDPGYALVAAPVPVLNRGDKPRLSRAEFPYIGTFAAAISAKSKNVEKAARFLDWNYGEAGYILNNFGIEGESFNWIDGYPTYTDIIMNNPDGWSIAQAMAAYIRAQATGPFVQDIRYLEQYYNLPEQRDAVALWTEPDMLKHLMPPLTPTPEETFEFSNIMGEVATYQSEMEMKFIIGTEPFSNWDAYVSTIKRLGIDRAVEIQNAALARYNER